MQFSIQRAITSGFPFRRVGWLEDEWLVVRDNRFYFDAETDMRPVLGVDDALAKDWVIKFPNFSWDEFRKLAHEFADELGFDRY